MLVANRIIGISRSIPKHCQQAVITSQRTSRNISSTTTRMASKTEWLVILPDKAGALEDRMKVRPQHLSDIKANVESGFWVFGGATLDSPPSDSGLAINGSAMLAVAEKEEDVWEKIRGDIYAKSGVWDLEKVKVMPFKSAIRKELPK